MSNGLNNAQISHLAADALLRALAQSGVRVFCSSPGFRNSPLIQALHLLQKEFPGIQHFSHIDERGAAFFALGAAKAGGAPAVCFCTSGTAAANFFPAVLEASYSHIPLICITADRPFEAIGTGSNQSLQQSDLFGGHVRFHSRLPAIGKENLADSLRFISYSGSRASAESLGMRPGPVHVNIAFREPFLANADEIDSVPKNSFEFPSQEFHSSFLATDPSPLRRFLSENPVLLLGPGNFSPKWLESLLSLARRSRVPVLAEASSGAGFTAGSEALISVELLLKSPEGKRLLDGSSFLRVGPPLTSKSLHDFLAGQKRNMILDFPGEARNPSLGPAQYIGASPEDALSMLDSALYECRGNEEQLQRLQELQTRTAQALSGRLESEPAFCEWHFAADLPSILPDDSSLLIGNSMPIRDFDHCAFSLSRAAAKNVRVFSSRGLSGIDGMICTAIGIAAVTKKPSFAVLGELTALHDLNALSLANRMEKEIALTLFVINNGGGEIFKIVGTKGAASPKELFTTPQSVDFASLASAFRADHLKISTRESLALLKTSELAAPGFRIVELIPSRERNLPLRQDFLRGL